MKRPEIIFFDLDETLIKNKIPIKEIFAEMYYNFADEIGKQHKRAFFYLLRDHAQRLWKTMFDFEATPESLLVACFRNSVAGLEQHSAEQCNSLANRMYSHFLKLSVEQIALHDDSLTTLSALSEMGYKTGIITNGIEEIQHKKMQSLNLYSKVDHVVISAQAKAHKPHKRVFKYALRQANTSAERAWLIGDHPKNDINGAANAGLTSVFYNPHQHSVERAFRDYPHQPDHIITELRQTLELLSYQPIQFDSF